MKRLLLLICLQYVTLTYASEFDLPLDMQLNVSGYTGWQQIISSVPYHATTSHPELGLMVSLKVTDSLNIFNQFKYGTNVADILVYNQIDYTPWVPIDNLEVKLKAGKIRYDSSLYAATRINPRTRQGVIQPQSIYWSTLGQNLTSGIGGGTDIKYKNLTISYAYTDPTINDASAESQAWTTRKFNRMTSKFGGFQNLAVGYDLPEYDIRTRVSWSKLKFNLPEAPSPLNMVSLELFNAGIEWQHDRFTFASEILIAKHSPPQTWFGGLDKLSKGFSETLEYELNEHYVLRANYNEYASTTAVTYPQQAYNRDLNIGVGWHNTNWVANMEGHWVRGGRIVATSDFNDNPQDYVNFFVLATNLVYFFN